jgi:hypothetical protein
VSTVPACRRRLLAVVLVLLAAPASAHVANPAIGRLEVDVERATYRLTLVPAEVGEPAQALARGAAGDGDLARQAVGQIQQHLWRGADAHPGVALSDRRRAALA